MRASGRHVALVLRQVGRKCWLVHSPGAAVKVRFGLSANSVNGNVKFLCSFQIS